MLESVLDEFKADLEAEQTQRERDLPPTVLLTVITIQPDAPPTIRFEGKADNQTAHVGNQTYHFDGKKITINP
jgi:hypothetical protein